MFQDFKLLPNRTAAENIGYALRVQGVERADPQEGSGGHGPRRPRTQDGLREEPSGGEQQRVSIARAMVNHPPLLVCDEPTGNPDPDTSVGIMQPLYRSAAPGTTILMVTHDREMVDNMRSALSRSKPASSFATNGAGCSAEE